MRAFTIESANDEFASNDTVTAELPDIEPVRAAPAKRGLLKRAWPMLRLLISLLLLGYVISSANWTAMLDLAKQMQVRWLLVFAALIPMPVVLSVWKWQVILRAMGHRVPFGQLFGMYVLSQFYNNILPSSVGGDVVRVMVLNEKIHSTKYALASIVVERFTGLTVLIVLAVVAVLSVPELRSNIAMLCLVGAVVMIYLGILSAIIHVRVIWLLRQVFGKVRPLAKIIDKLERFQVTIRAFRHQPLVLVNAILLSLAFYATAIVKVYVACRGFGTPIPVTAAAVSLPVVLAVGLLPITISGIGLTEWAFRVTFAAVGQSPDLGLTTGLLIRAAGYIWTCGGYLVYTLVHVGKPGLPAEAEALAEPALVDQTEA